MPAAESSTTSSSSSSSSSSILPAGKRAPDFDLPAGPEKTIALRSLRGKPVILAFYPADFSPVCGDQMALYNEVLPDFSEQGAQLLGVSVDGPWCHKAYGEGRKLRFPLLSDFEPKGAVSRAYGVYDSNFGTSRRALFVIDKDGVIAWSYLSPIDQNPGADGILSALEGLAK
jgi:peroxiredoxin